MKKIITTMVLALVLTLGMSVAVFADGENATVISATDSGGNPVSVSFAMETMDGLRQGNLMEFTEQFWQLGEDARKSLAAYYGCGEYDVAMHPYGGGILNLDGTNVSADNPVTITFSVIDDGGYSPKAGSAWLYAIQKLGDGSYRLIHAESTADGTITAQFTESGEIVFDEFDLARESFDYQEILEVNGVQSAVDAQGTPVTVTVTPLDEDRRMVAACKALELYDSVPLVTADVHLETSSVSETNPITVTFSIAGINAGDTISVLHKKADGSWETLSGTTGNGTVAVTFTSFSPVAFVRTTAAAPAPEPEQTQASEPAAAPAVTENNEGTTNAQAVALVSPKTGEEDVFGFAIPAAVLCTMAFACAIRKKTIC